MCAQKTDDKKPGSLTMWIGVGVVFALMALAWTAMFFFASKHRAESVPLETPGEAGRP
jgi:flagellar basal body-associated protein FliL